ncbi:hypothetical protein PsorP6_013616 [Peronosclerospora sorghi]|uniref:Uncharacterized protein n=1 Tax=Peronosclerospora sorghi TaxID=230839 RepID=A0ACC0VJ08_9STRA|nr:hypothetical protein PsorP6_013616 [Peronosclerospora sorghi]
MYIASKSKMIACEAAVLMYLQAEFGKYGEIMWPRSEEERERKRNCGFVSFYERRSADDARINLDNKELDDQRMVVGWDKAVKI